MLKCGFALRVKGPSMLTSEKSKSGKDYSNIGIAAGIFGMGP